MRGDHSIFIDILDLQPSVPACSVSMTARVHDSAVSMRAKCPRETRVHEGGDDRELEDYLRDVYEK